MLSGKKIALAVDLTLWKTITVNGVEKSKGVMTTSGDLLTVSLPLSNIPQKAENLKVFREHSGDYSEITGEPNSDGEFLERVSRDRAILHVKNFSIYVVTYELSGEGPSGPGIGSAPEQPTEGPENSTGSAVSVSVSKYIDSAKHDAFMIGDDLGLFRPDAHMTRKEMAQLFYNLLREEYKNTAAAIAMLDIEGSEWYAKPVNALSSLGLLEGYPDGLYHPDDIVSRAQFMAAAVRFGEFSGDFTALPPLKFTDLPKGHWAYDFIVKAAAVGWVAGTDADGTRCEPDRGVARAEIAQLVNNMLGRKPDKQAIDSRADLRHFPDVDDTKWYRYAVGEAVNSHDYEWVGGEEVWK
jgi:hypothetical protein